MSSINPRCMKPVVIGAKQSLRFKASPVEEVMKEVRVVLRIGDLRGVDEVAGVCEEEMAHRARVGRGRIAESHPGGHDHDVRPSSAETHTHGRVDCGDEWEGEGNGRCDNPHAGVLPHAGAGDDPELQFEAGLGGVEDVVHHGDHGRGGNGYSLYRNRPVPIHGYCKGRPLASKSGHSGHAGKKPHVDVVVVFMCGDDEEHTRIERFRRQNSHRAVDFNERCGSSIFKQEVIRDRLHRVEAARRVDETMLPLLQREKAR